MNSNNNRIKVAEDVLKTVVKSVDGDDKLNTKGINNNDVSSYIDSLLLNNNTINDNNIYILINQLVGGSLTDDPQTIGNNIKKYINDIISQDIQQDTVLTQYVNKYLNSIKSQYIRSIIKDLESKMDFNTITIFFKNINKDEKFQEFNQNAFNDVIKYLNLKKNSNNSFSQDSEDNTNFSDKLLKYQHELHEEILKNIDDNIRNREKILDKTQKELDTTKEESQRKTLESIINIQQKGLDVARKELDTKRSQEKEKINNELKDIKINFLKQIDQYKNQFYSETRVEILNDLIEDACDINDKLRVLSKNIINIKKEQITEEKLNEFTEKILDIIKPGVESYNKLTTDEQKIFFEYMDDEIFQWSKEQAHEELKNLLTSSKLKDELSNIKTDTNYPHDIKAIASQYYNEISKPVENDLKNVKADGDSLNKGTESNNYSDSEYDQLRAKELTYVDNKLKTDIDELTNLVDRINQKLSTNDEILISDETNDDLFNQLVNNSKSKNKALEQTKVMAGKWINEAKEMFYEFQREYLLPFKNGTEKLNAAIDTNKDIVKLFDQIGYGINNDNFIIGDDNNTINTIKDTFDNVKSAYNFVIQNIPHLLYKCNMIVNSAGTVGNTIEYPIYLQPQTIFTESFIPDKDENGKIKKDSILTKDYSMRISNINDIIGYVKTAYDITGKLHNYNAESMRIFGQEHKFKVIIQESFINEVNTYIKYIYFINSTLIKLDRIFNINFNKNENNAKLLHINELKYNIELYNKILDNLEMIMDNNHIVALTNSVNNISKVLNNILSNNDKIFAFKYSDVNQNYNITKSTNDEVTTRDQQNTTIRRVKHVQDIFDQNEDKIKSDELDELDKFEQQIHLMLSIIRNMLEELNVYAQQEYNKDDDAEKFAHNKLKSFTNKMIAKYYNIMVKISNINFKYYFNIYDDENDADNEIIAEEVKKYLNTLFVKIQMCNKDAAKSARSVASALEPVSNFSQAADLCDKFSNILKEFSQKLDF